MDAGTRFLWALIGFLIPIVGLILYLIWKDERPECARLCAKGALINVVIGCVLGVIAVLAVIGLGIFAAITAI